MFRYFLASISLFFGLFAAAQTYTISGRLTEDGATDRPIANATVQVKNSRSGAISKPNGQFSIELAPGKYTLMISSVGFAPQEIDIDVTGNMELNFSLKESLTNLPEFVVETNTLSGGHQGIQSLPGSVHYLDAKRLGEMKYANPNDVLKQIPGVHVQEEDGFGLRPNIGLRGSGLERSSKITIMEDGILSAPAPYSAPAAYYFPTMGRMAGLEVLKGASQVRFGPFTTGGAINFISTPIPTDQSAFIGLTGGNYGFRQTHAWVGDSRKNWGFVVESFNYGAEGFKSVPNGDTGFDKKDINTKFRVNTNPEANIYQSLTFSLGFTNEVSDETYLGLTDEDFAISPFRRYAASQVDQMNAHQRRMSLQHYVEIPGLFNIVTTAYRNDFKRNWYKLQDVGGLSLSTVLDNPIVYGSAFELLTGDADDMSGALRVRANNRAYISQGIQTMFDIEFKTGNVSHDIHISTRYHEDSEDRFQHQDRYGIENRAMRLVTKGLPGTQANQIESARAWASFLFYKLDIGKLSLTPGVRHETVTVSRENYGNADPDREGTNLQKRSNNVSAWLPGFGASYALTTQTAFFGGIHKGFAPAGSEEGTEAERSVNYELGARHTTKNLQATAVFFVNDYQNLLGQDNTSAGGTGSADVFNAGAAITKGVEMDVTYNVLSFNEGKWALPVSVAYTFTDSHFKAGFDSPFEDWGTVNENDRFPYMARHQLLVRTSLQHQKFNFAVIARYQSDMRTTPGRGEIEETDKISSFTTLDTSLNYFMNTRTSFFGSVTNLTDEVYAVARRPAGLRPGMPRAFRLGVTMTF
jgi:Fe(3+) dicitrate transport protein